MTNFASNPSNLQMYLHVPDSVTAHPAVLVAKHYCTGSGPATYSGTEYASLADRYCMAARVLTFFGLDSTGPAPQPQPGGCRVAVTTNAWDTGLTASVTLTNTGTTAVTGWQLGFTLPSGQTITNGWGVGYAPATGTVTATNASYNGTIAPGGAVTIGYQASHTGNFAAPLAFTLNGSACTVT